MKRIQTRVVVGVLALATLTCAAVAQDRTSARLVELNAAILQKAKTGQGQFDNAFRRIAAERRELMSKLAETDPAAALKSILPAETLGRMPADVAAMFERRGSFSGEQLVQAECEEHNFRTHRYVKSGDTSNQLYLDADTIIEMKTGDQITVEGYDLNGKILASADQATVTATASDSATTGEKRVIVILVNFQDKQTQPFTPEHARNVTFNDTSNYFREVSYGQTWFTGDVYGWFTIPMSSTSCDIGMIASLAQQAATNAGAVLSAYDHQVYAFPSNACGWTGSGSIGGGPGQVWINNSYNVNSVGHEIGHNFGLFHSRSLDCGSNVVCGTCSTNEYGDIFDIMGGGSAAHINLFQKERLGWVNNGVSPPIQTVTASGTYWIDAYGPTSYGTKGLKILKSTDPTTGKKTWYYLERRTAYGFDSYMAEIPNLMSGVLIHTGSEASGRDGYLLDMTPATTSWYDPALVAGQSFTDTTAGITITVLSADNTGALVQVSTSSQACTRANPTVAVTPGKSPWLTSGAAYTYTVKVTNNDGSGCPASNFNIGSAVPPGWMGTLSSLSASVSPGAYATLSLSVASPTGTVDGSYSVTATASNGAYSGSASAAYVIVSGLAVNATSSASTYTRSQTAKVTANIRAGGVPAQGATVTFTMTKPNGSVVTGTAMSDSNGDAVFQYSLNRKKDPSGTYQVRAQATSNGYSGNGTVAFAVK